MESPIQSFKAVSLSHENAPVAVREQMYLPEAATKQMLRRLHSVLDLHEVMVLSTCNRTEVYYNHPDSQAEDIIKLLAMDRGIGKADGVDACFARLDDHDEAVRHLFEVAMGLKSQVIGDLQISNQVKHAYAWAVEYKFAGPLLHRLMHTIFHGNKRVQQETAYRDGAASVSYAAVEQAKDLALYHADPSVLVLGLGEMGRDVARNLQGGPFSRVALCNRSRAKAEDLAAETGAEVVDFQHWVDAVQSFDVVVSSVAGDAPLITRDTFQHTASFHPRYLIDLSVPRSVASDVEEIQGVILYNIDDIRAKTNAVLEQRLAAVPRVRAIIDDEIAGFSSWSQEFAISPTIQKLKAALDQIRREELARFLKNATDREAELLEKATKSMMNKIIKLPVLQLKAACRRGEEENLIDVLSDLFDLESNRVPEEG